MTTSAAASILKSQIATLNGPAIRDREPPVANRYADFPWPLDHLATVRLPLTSTPSAPIFPLMWKRALHGFSRQPDTDKSQSEIP